MEALKPFLHWLHLHPHMAGIATFLIAMGESFAIIGLIVPGTILMTLIGTLIGLHIIPFWPITIWAILGAIAGDGVSYWFGYHFKHHIRDMWPFKYYRHWLDRGETFFGDHGGKSVFFGRFFGPIRPIIPLVAGMLKMRPQQFFIANIISGILWAPIYLLPGILLGAASIEFAPEQASKTIAIIIAILLLLWLVTKLVRWCYRHIFNFFNAHFANKWQQIRASSSPRWLLLMTDPCKPEGHGQLVLVVACIILMLLFSIVTLNVYFHGPLIDANLSIYYLVRSLYNVTTAYIMIGIALFANKTTLIPVIGLLTLYLLYKKHYRPAILFASASFIVGGAVGVIKYIINNPRPELLSIPPTTTSYPSGHTTLSAAIFGMLAVMVARELPEKLRKYAYLSVVWFTLLVMLSRLYLGAHWLTDVIGSVLFGSFVACIFTIAYRSAPKPNIKLKPFLTLFFVSLALSWTFFATHGKYSHMQTYLPRYKTQQLDEASWWQQQPITQAQMLNSRLGHPIGLINIQWLSTETAIHHWLINKGWIQTPKPDLKYISARLISKHKPGQPPLLPKLYHDQTPNMVYIKPLGPDQPIMLLNLWAGNIKLTNTKQTLWMGQVSFYHHHTLQLLHKKQQLAKLPAVMSLFAKDLQGLDVVTRFYQVPPQSASHKALQWQHPVYLIRTPKATDKKNMAKIMTKN